MQSSRTTFETTSATKANMRIAYLDCFAGISGDMFLGALIGSGVPASVLQDAAGALGLGASVGVSTVDRSGISSIKVDVYEGDRLAEQPDPHEHAQDHKHEHKHEHGQDHKHEHKHEHGQDHTHDKKHNDKHAHDDHAHKEHSHEHKHEHDGGHTHDHPHQHGRSLSKIRELIQNAPLPHAVRHRAIHTFELLGASEAKIHNVPVEKIHFHEVGAVDAIVDIVAACAGVEYLAARDAEHGPLVWHASPLNVGGGMVECAHGTFPVPAPATADLLRGMPTYSAHVQKELVTPTGAALLAALGPVFGPQPPMHAGSIGYGAGSRNPKGFPNVLRLTLGDSSELHPSAPPKHAHEPVESARNTKHDAAPHAGEPTHAEHRHAEHEHAENRAHAEASVTVLETALDDCTPQLLAHVAEQALHAGALDVMLAPVVMKKGRPGTLITILCNEQDAARLEDLLLLETPTLGVRRHRQHRSCLQRTHILLDTQYGRIRMKTGSRDGQVLNATPEFEDCRAAALTFDVPLKQVMQVAIAEYARYAAKKHTASVTVSAH
jgi:uncharacterized protein (TIGR00299 family) protein